MPAPFSSLSQSSYNTWNDGPFGTLREEKNKTISYYEKGPVVGLLLDLAIRNATLQFSFSETHGTSTKILQETSLYILE
jgi:predicted metalloprotease with PDZ domain